MKWFQGEIPAAIAESRQKDGVFAVVILHNPELSKSESEKMDMYWLEVDHDSYERPIVAIKIFDGTSTKDHFCQLYPVPVVPAAYLIDPNGRPLDVITLSNSPDKTAFRSRLDAAMAKLMALRGAKQDRQASASCIQASSINNANESLAAAAVQPSSSGTLNVTASSASTNNSSTSSDSAQNADKTGTDLNDPSSVGTQSVTLQEKVQRAQELLAKKHAEDEKKRRQDEFLKETERRNLGKQMSEAKAKSNEKEIRELAEQRRRERMDNERQLQRLREQIKADREEKMKRGRVEAEPINRQPETCSIMHRNKPASTECRIQTKFANGSSLLLSFQPTDTFALLVDKIKEDGRQGQDFVLTQNYPRRNFTVEDYSSTFAELDLSPSATILVFSNRSSGRNKQGALSFGLSSVFSFFFAPFQAILHYILSFIWPSRVTPRVTAGEEGQDRRVTKNSRQEGNIRRFHNREDSSRESDDEARWNGNSTQQL